MADSEVRDRDQELHRTSWILSKVRARLPKIATPLTKLTREGEKYIWTEECASAFEKLKNKLISAPILKTPQGQEEWLCTVMHQGRVLDVH